MTDYSKKQRNTLIIAAAVIILCLVTITSATFALFTTGNDGTIGINSTSGDIEVDIVDATDNPTSVVGEVLRFTNSAGELVFAETDVYFEPGAVFYTEGFRVVNKGEIPMNYIAYISEDKDFSQDFYDVFEVWITSNPTDRDKMEKLDKFKGRLEVGKSSDVYYLVFRMKETAGNEYQYKGIGFKGVGITVCAVQANAKTD